MQHFVIDHGVIKAAPRGSTIDSSQYKVQVDSQRYKVSANGSHTKFLVDFGLHENHRSTIICENAVEMLQALALVKAALDK